MEERMFSDGKKLECICGLRAGSQLRGENYWSVVLSEMGWLDLGGSVLLVLLRKVGRGEEGRMVIEKVKEGKGGSSP